MVSPLSILFSPQPLSTSDIFNHFIIGTNYVETLRVTVHANCRLRRIYFSDRYFFIFYIFIFSFLKQVILRGGTSTRVQVVFANCQQSIIHVL
jgi:hypothetical protein